MGVFVVLPSADSPSRDLHVEAPDGMKSSEITQTINREIAVVNKMDREDIAAGGDGYGEKELMRRLGTKGFKRITPIITHAWD